MSLITLPHAIFIYDESGNPVPVVSGSTLTSGSRGFVVYGKDGNNQARNFVVDASGNLGIQNPPNLDVSFSSRFNTLGQKSMSGSAPVVLPSDQTILVNIKQSNDTFSQPVVAGRYNQIEIAFDQTDPDSITDVTVTKTSGGDAVNNNGQAVFSSGINTNGGVKVVSNTSVAYRPHSEIYAAFTAIFTDGIASSYQRIGIYDTNNGFFVGYEGTSFGVTIRKAGVDTTTARASFNVDTLTGAATSKYTRNGVPETLDTTKDNLYRIRFGWLGAAPILFEVLSPDGEWVTFHTIRHPNTTAGTSINNPDLPITLDIKKTTAGATNLTVSTACWAAGTTSDLAKVSSAVTDNSLVKFVRSVLTAKKPNGDYTNIQATAGGNLKVSVEEFDPAVFGEVAMSSSLPVVIANNQTPVRFKMLDANATPIRATVSQELKVAQLYTLADLTSKYELDNRLWDTLTSSGGTATHVPTQSALRVSASGVSGSSAVCRTNTFYKYQSGYTQYLSISIINSDTGSANQIREWGYFDDNDGLFFRLSGTQLQIVERTSVSGTPVETIIPQSTWNKDKLNGTGASGITLDLSKGNIFEIELQWFGVGTARYYSDGVLIHETAHANTLPTVYMRTANLPVSFGIRNTAATNPGSVTMVCARVAAQGQTHDPFEWVYSISNPTDKLVGLTEIPVLSIRPKDLYNGIVNRSWIIPKNLAISTEGYKIGWKLIYGAQLSGSSWTSVTAKSAAEYDISATSYTDGEVIYRGFTPQDTDTSEISLEPFFDIFGRIIRTAAFTGSGSNVNDVLTITAVCESVGNTKVRASMTWSEVK